MATANVTVNVDASQVNTLINSLQQVVNLEQQASRSLTININTTQIENAARSFDRMATAAQNVSTIMRGLGSMSNSLGNFASGIGNSFSRMSSLFGNNNVATALTRFVTYNALRGVTSNISNMVSRYDIMSTFLPYMNVAGVDNTTAQAALDRVNESILGLPIGLDESAQRLRRYQMFLGDVEDATNLTIGLQNAILAGGASDQMKTTAYYQIDRLLSAGKLNQSRQWLALIQGLGVSMKFLSEQMGVADMDVRDLADGLTHGQISTESFLNALMELGKGESDAAQGLQATLDIYKGTIQAWVYSIEFAFARGGENVIKALNQTLVDTTGQGITGYMKNYRDYLNEAFKGVANWIKDNPESLTGVMNSALNVLREIQRFSASEFASKATDNIKTLFNVIATALASIPEGRLESFAAFATTIAKPLGQIMEMSSGLGMLIGVFERFENFDFNTLIGNITEQIGLMADVVQRLLSVLDDEQMSKLLAIGLVWGKPVGSALSGIASTASTVAMMRLAFGNLGSAAGGTGLGALFGGLGSGLGSAGSGLLTALTLGTWTPLLATLGAGAAATYGLMNWRQNQRADAVLEQMGLAFAAGGTSGLRGQTNAAIQAANEAYMGVAGIGLPITTTDRARTAYQTIQNNISNLSEAYQNESDLLYALEAGREALVQKYDETWSKVYERTESGALVRKYGGYTQEDLEFLDGYERALGFVDSAIDATQEDMAALNAEMVKEGTEAGKLVLKFGDLEIVVGNTAKKYQEAERYVSEYEKSLQQLVKTHQAIREANLEAVQKQLSGFQYLEPATPGKSPSGSTYDSFLSQDKKALESEQELTEQAATNLDSLKEYIDGLGDGDETGVNLSNYIHEILALDDIEQIAPRLQEVIDEIGPDGIGAKLNEALSSFEIKEDAAEHYKTALDSFGTASDGFLQTAGKLKSEAEAAANAIKEVPGAWKEAMGLLDEGLDEWSGDLPAKAQTLGTGISQPMDDMAGKVKGSADKTNESVESIDATLQASKAPSSATTLSNGIATGMEAGVSRVEAASQAIQAAIAALDGLSATVTINTVTNDSAGVSGDSGGGELVQRMTGQQMATGGSVFKPLGSDIVPAMLTPGEYIIRKGAVDFFGKGLMDRINSLDIGGAFDRLMLSPPMMSRFGGNVYNRDSHNNVTQNVYTNNPNFANKRAWRFAL